MHTVEEFLAKLEEERDRIKRDIARKDDLIADINLEIDQRRKRIRSIEDEKARHLVELRRITMSIDTARNYLGR